MLFAKKTLEIPTAADALPGRAQELPTADVHFVNGHPLKGPWPEGLEQAVFAMGCFWGVERIFWQIPGVWSTAVGYVAGATPNPTYQEVCSGRTGHAEGVEVTFDPSEISYGELVDKFWSLHDPTQVDRQGWDVGSQYRSAIFTHSPEQAEIAAESKARAQARFSEPIATEVVPATTFWPAEEYHQQYLVKNGRATCRI